MNLENNNNFRLILAFENDEAFTFGNTTIGKRDIEKRDYIRSLAAQCFPEKLPKVDWWAFKIKVFKAGKRKFDIDNVPKLIVDAFCKGQLQRDGSNYIKLGLYEDDSVENVRYVEIYGQRGEKDYTLVQIFGFKE